jgi:hypothetical protein
VEVDRDPPALLFQTAFVEFDEIEISFDIFPAVSARFLEEVKETRLLRGRIGVPGDHGLIPFFDSLFRMPDCMLPYPVQDGRIIVQTMGRFFKGITIDLEKGQEMFIETNGLVVVAVKQPLAMELGLIDQTRQMDEATQLLVRAPRMRLSLQRRN